MVSACQSALQTLHDAHVPKTLVACMFQQVLGFVNCQLFNQLLLRPECCSVGNARYALRGLKQLDGWIVEAGGEQDLTGAWDALIHIRQVTNHTLSLKFILNMATCHNCY